MKVWHNKPENTFQCKKKIQYIVELFLLLNEQPAPLNSKDVFLSATSWENYVGSNILWGFPFAADTTSADGSEDNINEFQLEALTDKQRAKTR